MITVYGENVTTEDLKDIEVQRPPRAGRHWQGVKHHDLVTQIRDRLSIRNIGILDTRLSLSPDKQALAGAMILKFPESFNVPECPGGDYALGFRHTNDMKYAVTFACGQRVSVCNNGMISGEFVLSKRHTKGLRLGDEVEGGVIRFLNESHKVVETVRNMQALSLTSEASDSILMSAGREGLASWGHIGMVEREYRNPRYKDFQGRNGWCLYNAFTTVVQDEIGGENPHPRISAERQLRSMNRMRELILSERQIAA
jgi:hypothetical protein